MTMQAIHEANVAMQKAALEQQRTARAARVANAGFANTSGFVPLDQRVLVRPDPVEEKTKGGIILPDEHKEQQKFATVKGTLIAVGINAWFEARSVSEDFAVPQPGQRVLIAKYGGVVLTGEDGEDYRIMNDEDVIGMITGGN